LPKLDDLKPLARRSSILLEVKAALEALGIEFTGEPPGHSAATGKVSATSMPLAWIRHSS
jgi:hypothetical protein